MAGDYAVYKSKIVYLFFLLLLSVGTVWGQNVIENSTSENNHLERDIQQTRAASTFTEGFESGVSRWEITHNDTQYNRWIWSRNTSQKHNGNYSLGAPNAFGPTNKITNAKVQLDFSAYSDIKLTFSYKNPSMSSYPYTWYDTLRIVAEKVNGNEEVVWSSNNSTGWKNVTNLVIPSGTKYIIFRAKNKQGGGVYIDDVSITYNCSTPSLTLTNLSNQTICVGESVTLNPNPTSNGEVSYSWSDGTTGSTLQATASGTYRVIVTSTIGTCTTSRNTSATITVNTPVIENVSSYDYIWRGATSAYWSTASNWYVYNNGYSVATSVPTIDKNIYIGPSSQCVSNTRWPTSNTATTASAKNITVASGATLTIPANKTLNIAGSITNNGTFTANVSSTVVFKGDNDQTITGAMTFGKVAFNQTVEGNKITASSGITVNTSATFTKGVVVGDMAFARNATVSGANTLSFVDGKVTKVMKDDEEFQFPTGKGTQFARFDAAASNNAEVSVRYNLGVRADDGIQMPDWWEHGGNMGSGDNKLDHVSDREHWLVSSSADLSSVTLNWSDGSDVHSFESDEDLSKMRVAYADKGGFAWTNAGGTASGTWNGSGSISATANVRGTRAADSERFFTFASTDRSNLLLPIELLSFKAICNGRSAKLEWTTASERNNEYFVIERSDDAVNFTEIARLASVGNSIKQIDYSYNDYG
ncbi:MAG: hypothetical protein IK025_13090, partial [Bacteroidales bacterium]|nr:hypothetical protein [Bacteroidales bacterium]